MRLYTDACTFLNGKEGQDSSIAVVLEDGTVEGKLICVRHLGDVSVNVAEYSGVIAALEWAHTHNTQVRVCTDSALVAGQVRGRTSVLAKHLGLLCSRAQQLLIATGSTLDWVPRGENLAGHYWERFHRERKKGTACLD